MGYIKKIEYNAICNFSVGKIQPIGLSTPVTNVIKTTQLRCLYCGIVVNIDVK